MRVIPLVALLVVALWALLGLHALNSRNDDPEPRRSGDMAELLEFRQRMVVLRPENEDSNKLLILDLDFDPGELDWRPLPDGAAMESYESYTWRVRISKTAGNGAER